MPVKEMYIKTRVTSVCKKKAEKIVQQMGLDMSSYLRLCIHQLIEDRAIPFKPHLHGAKEEDILISNSKKQAILDYLDE